MDLPLKNRPKGVGKPITDRAAWEALVEDKSCLVIIQEAEKLLDSPPPDIPDEVYLEFSRTGHRDSWQGAERSRRRRLKPLVLAECIENKGRFLPAIEHLISLICSERTWIMPVSDTDLVNFRCEKQIIDLWSAALAWELATTDYLLGDYLSETTRQMVAENIRRRILDPFQDAFTNGVNPSTWWMEAKFNWNTVCLAGVIGAAVQQIESPQERAQFIAAGIQYSKNFLDGFPLDGYCHEGLGYWNYGLQHYVLLSRTIQQATNDQIDLMNRADVPRGLIDRIAQYPFRIHIMNGIYPAFSDCDVKIKPNHNLMCFINRRWNLGLKQYMRPLPDGELAESVMALFDGAEAVPETVPAMAATDPLRDWFEVTGVLVCRPSEGRMGVAMLGANNGEIHNHNDIGSYVVVLGQAPVLFDPGHERYTGRTFSPRRYESDVLNSFGHPVPIVAGQLQREGSEARAEIIKVEFSGKADLLEMQIRSAYAVEDLVSLTRSFVYNRQPREFFAVTDQVEFSSPQTFSTSLIASGACERKENGVLMVRSGEETLTVIIDTDGEPFEINVVEIKEETPIRPVRIGIDLSNAVLRAKITAKIMPA